MLVTGASRGLGRSIAQAFGQRGDHVAVGFQRARRQAEETAALVEKAGGTASLHEFDVRDRRASEAAIDAIAAKRGLDVLVNNAGVVGDQLAVAMSEEHWRRVIDVDLTGAFNCARAAASNMLRVGSGSIVNVASVAALRASPGQANYSAAKGGLLAMTRTLAAELARFGVRVNDVVPGLLDTGMGQRLNADVRDAAVERIPAGRLGSGAEVASAVVFLASDEARYVFGQALVVDGGLSL